MNDVPTLGFGLGYRAELHDAIMAHRASIDWLEVITDHYLGDPALLDQLDALREVFPLVTHGLEMSVGSDGPLDLDYLAAVGRVADAVDAPWVSDHLCFTRDGGVELDNLTPVVRTLDKARSVAARAQEVQDRLGRPFLLENITYYIDMPGELTEAELITEVLDHCDCGLLLDLNNVVVNARNHGFDAIAFVDALPLDRVVQVHLAGNAPGAHRGEVALDGHDAPVGREVFALLDHLRHRQPLKGVMIERDDAFPEDFQEIVDDLTTARAIVTDGTAA
ncbi:DUF692 domain-containing protein [Saccharomonospora piscinae]|uniref:DUF692 domain-containing protein n=1 Tax=Saccharomonospora piscinae TaxID=687388 RepID=UPI000464D260|nr:DUF692 domain-containing protein [Saccharomonospora piscinae]